MNNRICRIRQDLQDKTVFFQYPTYPVPASGYPAYPVYLFLNNLIDVDGSFIVVKDSGNPYVLGIDQL